jgi:hypothetical protein
MLRLTKNMFSLARLNIVKLKKENTSQNKLILEQAYHQYGVGSCLAL